MDIKNQTWIDKIIELFDYTNVIIGFISIISSIIFLKKSNNPNALLLDIITEIKVDYFSTNYDFSNIYIIVIVLIVLNIIGLIVTILFELTYLTINKMIHKVLEIMHAKIEINNAFGAILHFDNQKIVSVLYEYFCYKDVLSNNNSNYKNSNYNYKIKYLINHLRIYYNDSYKFINKEIKLFEITKVFLVWVFFLFYVFHIKKFMFFDSNIINTLIFLIFFHLWVGFIYSFFREQVVGNLVSIFENIENKPL